MPSYIGYRPQFEPISLQEYLTVPMMILEGRQKEADKIEQYQNEAEKYRAMMGDSPEAQAIWAAYDNALNNLGDNILNNKTGDLTRAAKKIGDSFRNIKYKAEEAQKALDEDTKRFANNPNLIGKPADFMTYYNDPHYRATAVNGKDIQDAVSAFADSYASTLPVENRGYVDPTTKHDILYERGLTPEQKNILYQDALSENPQTSEGAALRQTLQTAGIDLSNPEAVSLASRYIKNGMRSLDRKGFTQTNPLFRTSGQQASDALAWMKVKEAKENRDTYGTITKPSLGKDELYIYDDFGNELIQQRKSNNQYIIYKWENGKRVMVPSYVKNGKTIDSKNSTGIYEFEKPESTITKKSIEEAAGNQEIYGYTVVKKDSAESTKEDLSKAVLGIKSGKTKITDYSRLNKKQQNNIREATPDFNSDDYYIIQSTEDDNKFVVVKKTDVATQMVNSLTDSSYVDPSIVYQQANNVPREGLQPIQRPQIYPKADTTNIINLPIQ